MGMIRAELAVTWGEICEKGSKRGGDVGMWHCMREWSEEGCM